MEILIYVAIIFLLANFFYFLFLDGKQIKRRFWLTISILSLLSFIIAIFLNLISSDSLIDNTNDFFVFIISSIVLSIIILQYHLELHKILSHTPTFSKNYVRYLFSFSFFAFFLNIIFFIVLFIVMSIIFDIE